MTGIAWTEDRGPGWPQGLALGSPLGNPWDPGDLGELGLAAKAWLNIAARAANFWSWFCPMF